MLPQPLVLCYVASRTKLPPCFPSLFTRIYLEVFLLCIYLRTLSPPHLEAPDLALTVEDERDDQSCGSRCRRISPPKRRSRQCPRKLLGQRRSLGLKNSFAHGFVVEETRKAVKVWVCLMDPKKERQSWTTRSTLGMKALRSTVALEIEIFSHQFKV